MVLNFTANSTSACKLGQILPVGCFFTYNAQQLTLRCGLNQVQVTMLPAYNNLSCTLTGFSSAKLSILDDAFRAAVYPALFVSTVNYNMTITANTTISAPSYYEIYTPLGLWAEPPINSPRSWLPTSQPYMDTPFMGNNAIYNAAVQSHVACFSNARCVFDVSPMYDMFSSSASTQGSWQGVLQNIIASATVGTGISTFAALYLNSTVYNQILTQFANVAYQALSARIVSSYLTHPQNNNLWVVRSNGLFEIAKSGVQIQVANGGGSCMPSGVALCAQCQWATAGGQCRPCSTYPSSSRAWSLSCTGCTNSRRLLQQSPSTTLEFVVLGSYNTLSSLLNNLPACGTPVWTLVAAAPQQWDIRMQTSDPVSCMRALKPALNNVQVLIAPHTSIVVSPLSPATPAPASSSDQSVWITVCTLLALFGSCILVAWCCSPQHTSTYEPVRASSDPGVSLTSRLHPKDIVRCR